MTTKPQCINPGHKQAGRDACTRGEPMNACPFPDASREARYWQDGWIEKRQRQADQEAEERREAIAAANRRADADSHRWAYADVAEALDKLGIDPHRLKAYLDGLADD